MSRSAGPGSPAWFNCPVYRRESPWDKNLDDHVIELTGNQRPYRPSAGSAIGLRSTFVTREYKCSCGHVGWSNHVELQRMEESGC